MITISLIFFFYQVSDFITVALKVFCNAILFAENAITDWNSLPALAVNSVHAYSSFKAPNINQNSSSHHHGISSGSTVFKYLAFHRVQLGVSLWQLDSWTPRTMSRRFFSWCQETLSFTPWPSENYRSRSVTFSISTLVSIAALGALAESERGNQQVGGNCARGATRLPYHFHRDTKPTSGSPGLIYSSGIPRWTGSTNFVIWLISLFTLLFPLQPVTNASNSRDGKLYLICNLVILIYFSVMLNNSISESEYVKNRWCMSCSQNLFPQSSDIH